jgi:hydrogenase-4 component F
VDPARTLYLALLAPALFAALALLRRPPTDALRLLTAGTVACAAALLPALRAVWRAGGSVTAAAGWLRLDALSALHAVVVAIVFVPAAVHAGGYFRYELARGAFPAHVARRFAALWFGALAALLLVLFSNNLGVMWVGIEATTLLTAFLICTHLSPGALEAMWKYLLMCSVGVAVAFMGILLLAASTSRAGLPASSALLWTHLAEAVPRLDPALVKAGFLFLVVGFGTKAGLAPMHNWLPDAHSQAPAPVSAVLSGCLLNGALYCILRVLPLAEGATGSAGWAREVLIALGLLSMALAAGFILAQRDLKRLLAYSSIEHLGVMALGVGLGAAGAFAALLHMVGHALAKPLGFFCAGRVGQAWETQDMRRIGGVVRRAPLWGLALVLALLALAGTAPGVLFLSEVLVLKAAIDGCAPWTAAAYLAILALTFIGVLRRAIALGWDDSMPAPAAPPPAPALADRLLVWTALALLTVLGLCLPFGLAGFLRQAAAIVTGGAP